MNKLTFLVSATLLSALSAAALADGDKTAMPAPATTNPTTTVTAAFDSLDKNADQQISKTEAASDKAVSDSFASADGNGDGYLNKAEFAALKGRT
jgi:Ca2+-binding EF-hand superfamily protein